MEILRCNGIEKVFGKGDNQVIALNGISLSIEKVICRNYWGIWLWKINAFAYFGQRGQADKRYCNNRWS